jgi:hypothetical protein
MNSGLTGALGAAPLRVTGMTRKIVTASPNADVNALQIQATGGSRNVDLVLTPKGNGAFIVGNIPNAIADQNGFDGMKRGSNAVEINSRRPNPNGFQDRVASGQRSVLIGSDTCRATGARSVVIGGNNDSATGSGSIILGGSTNNGASGDGSAVIAGGYAGSSGLNSIAMCGNAQVSAAYTSAIGRGSSTSSPGKHVWAQGAFGSNDSSGGSAQALLWPSFRCTVTGTTPTELLLTSFSGVTNGRASIPSGFIISGIVEVVAAKSDGITVARFLRQFTIKNVAGTTSMVGDVVQIGSDESSGTNISITADDVNDSLKIVFTGIATETWRATATIRGTQLAYGT